MCHMHCGGFPAQDITRIQASHSQKWSIHFQLREIIVSTHGLSLAFTFTHTITGHSHVNHSKSQCSIYKNHCDKPLFPIYFTIITRYLFLYSSISFLLTKANFIWSKIPLQYHEILLYFKTTVFYFSIF